MSKNNSSYKLSDHQLSISPLRLWIRLLRQNKTSKQSRRIRIKITLFVIVSAPFRLVEKLIVSRRIKKVDLQEKPPVFVIGHWRSGTTHLHYLLALDKQFSCLTAFQAFFYHVAFVSKSFMKPLLQLMMPKTRPQDNVKIDSNSPTEEEHPLVNCTEKSGMQTFFFPKNRSYFDKFNLFERTTDSEIESWKKVYDNLLKKIALFEGVEKRLLLKNPHNTGRVRVLLEMYPNAKFIYIHRNPYEVFSSSKILYNKTIRTQFLQDFSDEEVDERILYSYEKTLNKYLECRSLIPKDQLIEVSYKDLDENPMDVLNKIYSELRLGDIDSVRPIISSYLESLNNFKKNKTTVIPEKILKEINVRWKFAFNEWGYEITSD